MANITLISDFSLSDAGAAIAKGVLLQHMPDAILADITHDVQQFNKKHCAYLMAATWRNFPPGTFHIAMVDIFYQPEPVLVAIAHEGHYFLAPDNGILPQLFRIETMEAHVCMRMHGAHSFPSWIRSAADTILNISRQKDWLNSITTSALQTMLPLKSADANTVVCEVVNIDAFENVVLDFTRSDLERMGDERKFAIRLPLFDPLSNIKLNYNDVIEGEALCRFNSSDYLEICINHGRAASLMGLKLGKRKNQVQIEFQ